MTLRCAPAAALPASTLLVLAPPAAYPISPMTLWELTDSAELVVLARVGRSSPRPLPARPG